MSLKIDKLKFSYGTRQVLEDISFEAEYGEFLSILGPNGVGKSTLFRCILGLRKPSSGQIRLNEKEIGQFSAQELAKEIAYIPQSHNPVFNYSVLDMVLMGTTSQVERFASPGKAQIRVAEDALERLGISHLKGRSYNKISGGERQITLIARAIAQQAKILVMDEPSASLDFGNRIKVMQTIRSLTADGYMVIQSTHDPEQAYMYSDKILALHDGKILAHGKTSEVMTSQMISTLYGVNVRVESLRDDNVRVCLPVFPINKTKAEE